MKNKFLKIILGLLAVLVLEVLFFSFSSSLGRKKIDKENESKIQIIQLKNEEERKKLNDEFEMNKYLAGGKDTYERIYNSQANDITDLLQKLTTEALPATWKSEIKVEEFTKFILLIQNQSNVQEFYANEIGKYLIPILNYGGQYLKNVAVFNDKHQSYLYFDEDALNQLSKNQTLSNKTIASIKNKGINFTKFNAIKIDYEDQLGHILINDVTISGVNHSISVPMMLDTGASITTISPEFAKQTGQEDLDAIKREKFSTSNGIIECPIVEREIIISSFDKKLSVAVCPQTDINLLGVNFFESMNYVIDAESKSIYVWSK